MLLSDRGLDDETPESDAHDFTDADRTIFGTLSSGEGEFEGNIARERPVTNDGHDEAVANKYDVAESSSSSPSAGQTVDVTVGGGERLVNADIG